MHITKETCSKNFLQIKNEDWQEAARALRHPTFILYLYLSSNSNGYEFGLSQADVTKVTGISESSYHRGVSELIENGYITHIGGNRYNFCPSRYKSLSDECIRGEHSIEEQCIQPEHSIEELCVQGEHSIAGMYSDRTHTVFNENTICSQVEHSTVPSQNTEIDNIDNIDSIDTAAQQNLSWTEDQISRRRKNLHVGSNHPYFATCLDGCPGRGIRDLTRKEAEEIRSKMKHYVSFDDIYTQYNLRRGVLSIDFFDVYNTVVDLYGENVQPILSPSDKEKVESYMA